MKNKILTWSTLKRGNWHIRSLHGPDTSLGFHLYHFVIASILFFISLFFVASLIEIFLNAERTAQVLILGKRIEVGTSEPFDEEERSPSTTAIVTAYSELDSCHYPGCIMASGKKAYVGAAACPRSIPLGTRVRIGEKLFTCEDRTAKHYDGRYDLFMGYGEQAHTKALKWGIQHLPVEIERG